MKHERKSIRLHYENLMIPSLDIITKLQWFRQSDTQHITIGNNSGLNDRQSDTQHITIGNNRAWQETKTCFDKQRNTMGDF